jgi:hypothetical protein
MYLQAAFDTAEFIHAHLYTDSHDVQNGMSARQSDFCKVDPSTDPGYSGVVIEGLSILASISKMASTQLMRVLAFLLFLYRLNHK